MPRAEDAEARALIAGASELGIELPSNATAPLLRFLDLIYAWNRSAGLTSVARADAVRLHLLDSLSVVRFLPSAGRIADLGSGAGLPGIPVALAMPGTDVFLVETRRRKCSFLREAVRELGLARVKVVERDARRFVPEGEPFDAVVARAFLCPADVVSLAAPLIGEGGRIIVMGARRTAELDQVGGDRVDLVRRADEPLTLPGGTEQRRIVVLQKRSGDPDSQTR